MFIIPNKPYSYLYNNVESTIYDFISLSRQVFQILKERRKRMFKYRALLFRFSQSKLYKMLYKRKDSELTPGKKINKHAASSRSSFAQSFKLLARSQSNKILPNYATNFTERRSGLRTASRCREKNR